MGQTPSPMPREVAEPRHEGATVSHAVKQEPPPRRERRSWLIPILIGVFTLVALGFLYTTWQGTWWPTSTSETPTVAETPTPEPAATPAALPPAPVAPVVAATPATKPKPEAKKTEATPAPAPTPVAPESDGYLTVADLQPYAEVYVDGAYKDTTPAGKIPLAPGKHTVKLVNPQAGKSAVLTVEILPGKKFFITKWPQ
jgi:serine/threonine-protein kinase